MNDEAADRGRQLDRNTHMVARCARRISHDADGFSGERIFDPVEPFSGGEKARALLARVLAGEPQWILADEPLAALDLAHQQSLLAHLRSAAHAGAGVVIVLHDLATAMNHVDRVLVLREGRVVSDGSPDDALSPQNIANGWGVEARWIGETGAKALVLG